MGVVVLNLKWTLMFSVASTSVKSQGLQTARPLVLLFALLPQTQTPSLISLRVGGPGSVPVPP